MKPGRHVEMTAYRRHRTNVVEMGVGQPDGSQVSANVCDRGDQAFTFVPRIYDRCLTAVAIHDEIAVLLKGTGFERQELERRQRHTGTPASRRAVRNFSAAMAAVVASPTAVVTCRVSWTRTSPAANKPGTDVCMFVSVRRYPIASCSTCPSMIPVFGRNPMNTNIPVAGSSLSTPVFACRRVRW